MKTLKHIGRMKKNNAKVLVVFRTLPGEANQALVVSTSQLSDSYHDSIMALVESDQAQESFEFGEIMHIRPFPDGKPMLVALKEMGLLVKVPTDQVIMTPNTQDTIELHSLNTLIAEQRNCAVDDLCTFVSGAPKKTDATVEDIAEVRDLGRDVGEPNIPQSAPQPLKAAENAVLTDRDIAKSYRSQADAMYKEAAKLRKQADELDPPQKKSAKVKETSDA
jgi:hypothetical protein